MGKGIWLLAAAAASGCGSYAVASMPDAGERDAGPGYVIEASSYKFTPPAETVSQGNTVTWHNGDVIDHTVTSGAQGQPNGLFDALLHPGDSFSYTFATPGSYPYFCRFHYAMGMSAMVTVQPPYGANP